MLLDDVLADVKTFLADEDDEVSRAILENVKEKHMRALRSCAIVCVFQSLLR